MTGRRGEPNTDPPRAVKRLFGIYVQHLMAWDRHLLAEVMVATLQPDGDELAAGIAQMHERCSPSSPSC